MKSYGMVDERTPLTKTLPPDYVYMTNPNRLYRKQVHQFQCCICAIILGIFTIALAITILYSVDEDIIDFPPLPSDNASLQLLLSKTWPLPDDGVPGWQVDSPTPEELEAAVKAGKDKLAERDKLEAANPSLPVNSPSYRHQVSIKTSARATNLARSAYLMEVATKTFMINKSKPKILTKTVGRGPVLSSDWLPSEECGVGPLPPCPPSKYRTIDGSCNNPYKPNKWGVAMRPYRRQLAQVYADGISKPRTAKDGNPLPSARDVSVTVHRPEYRDDPKFTVMLAVWGQFMDHDVTATAGTVGAGGKPISCCQNSSTQVHPECFPVHLSTKDAYYQQFDMTCMEFVRSAPAPTCSLGPREQLNQVSSYLDASVVYGNTAELARSLRTYQGGQLKMLETPDGRQLLPISTNLEDGCNREAENAKGRYCFMSGDARANENTHLTSLHTLMARQHNVLATQLADLNPEWSDEELYQESRKIVSAQMQHITYNEFLPVLLGPDMMEKLDLNPKQSGYYTDYSPSVDATVSNNFATSSFRFAHTLLPALMKTVAKDWGSEESIEMHKMLFDPYKLYQAGALDKVLQGAISTKLERADSYFNTQVTEHLFQATGEDDKPSAPRYGLDLVSLNVQRGRDHGLPPYPAWRQYCGLKVPTCFDDMVGMVDAGSLEKMKAIYKSVDDIDMYTGALSEFPVEGGLVGPTVTCLVSDQFKRLKQGDSYWYETNKQPQAFSLAQLDEIRKTTLAGIICDASDEVTTVQPFVMKSIDPENIRGPCSAISRPDITKWIKDSNGLKDSSDGSVGLKYIKVSLTVTGGLIRTNGGEIIWDGTLPTSLNLPLFNVKPILKVLPGGSSGNGIQWQGSTSVTSDGLVISGTFSYPVFIHGPIPLGTNFSAKWVNGEFNLKASITADIDIGGVSFFNTYESPIYFSQEKVSGTIAKKQLVLGTTFEDAPVVVGVEKLPVILIGSYSPDKKSFHWDGKAVINFPTPPSSLKLLAPASEGKPPSSGAFSVIGGSVKLQSSDGASLNLWSGEFPTVIPVPLPYKILAPGGAWGPLPVFGNGLEWSTSISGSLLEGSFAFPQYNRTFGFPQVNWLSGQFSLEVSPLGNVTFEELVTPGVKYTSRIIFREEPASMTVKLNSVFYESNFENSIENLIVESQEVVDGVIPAPLILLGTFSPDKTVFYFNGKVILAVKPTKPKIEKQMKLLKSPEPSASPWISPKFGGFVNSGFITTGLDGTKPSTIWTGTVPAAIQMPTFFSPGYDQFGEKSFLFGNGIVWSGTLSGKTIKGVYTLPQTSKSMTGITTQIWSGEFSFEVSALWNTTLASIFVPGAKYYSKIHFQGAKYEPGITTLKGVPGEDPSVTMAAPIVLQGSFSLDKKIFYWSGNFIITFRNKPYLSFTIPTKPKEVDSSKPSITLDVTSGTIFAGFIGAKPTQVWGGELPATIPYSSLLSKDSWNPIPSPPITWTGEVKDSIFRGTFAVPIYRMNGTVEDIDWWVGNFSFEYVARYGQLLESFVVPGRKYDFKLNLLPLKKSSDLVSSENRLLEFTQEAQQVIDDVKPGKVLLFGNYYSKSFYCYLLPLCSEKKEYYWSGALTLNFPASSKNNTFNELKINPIPGVGKPSSQFGGKVVSGSVEGGLSGESTNVWWTGNLPVTIPLSVFRMNKTQTASGSVGTYKINWSGSLIGNTLTGSFSFPQIVQDYPIPTTRTWNGRFSFEIEPLWNTTLDGLIKSEVKYSSGLYFQGIKGKKEYDTSSLYLGDTVARTQIAPIILQGNVTPDGLAFLWSGQFIISVKNYPAYPSLTLKKPKVNNDFKSPTKSPKLTKPTTQKPVKPKLTVNFAVLTGQLVASNGSDPVTVWGGQMPVEINTDLFNPTATAGAGVSLNWSPTSLSPQVNGTFSVTVFPRNGSVLVPVSYTGNFSFYYLAKWGGSFMGLIKPEKQYTCNVVFKAMPNSSLLKLSTEELLSEDVPKHLILGDGEQSGEMCTLILSGKTYVKSVDPLYCNVIPFTCSNQPDSNWFSFNGDALLVIKPPTEPSNTALTLKKPKVNNDFKSPTKSPKLTIPTTQKPVKPKLTVNFAVLTGQLVASNGSDPVTVWGGQMPVEINTDLFNPTATAGAGVSLNWSPTSLSPQVNGTFSVTVFPRNGSVLVPVSYTGNFSFYYLAKWGGSFMGLIKPEKQYTCNVVFKAMPNSSLLKLSTEELLSEDVPKHLILGDGEQSGEMCTLILSGKTYVKSVDPLYCNVIPFMCSNQPDSNWFSFNGDALLVIKPPTEPSNTAQQLMSKSTSSLTNIESSTRQVNTKVIGGSIVGGLESDYPTSLWSGELPVAIQLPVFWSDDVDGSKVSSADELHAHGVIWSGSQMGPRVDGSFSLPQYSKTGIKWWTGRFSFLFQSSWGKLEDLDELVASGINYKSRVIFRDIDNPNSLTAPSQIDIDTATNLPIILLGKYGPGRKIFYWSGNTIIVKHPISWVASNQLSTMQFQGSEPDVWPMKPKLRVGALVSSGSVTNVTEGVESPIWSGSIPITIPLTNFNISRGVNVIWSASSLYPKFSGRYSIPQFQPNGETFKIKWTDGNFSFNLLPLWNTSLDIIDIGKEYATIIGSSISKLSQSEEAELLSSFQSLIMESADLAGSPLGKISLKGLLSPDSLNFVWQGEAWFYPGKNDNSDTKTNMKLKKENDKPLYLSQFGGSVYDGSVTSGKSSFFSLSHTIWSGIIPATIPLSAFWSGSIMFATFTKGVTWTASSVTDSMISGSYSVPQFSWDGITTSVTWFKGDFQFYIRPLWNATITSLIQPGVQYYSTINFQGEKPTLNTDNSVGVPLVPTSGVKAPIILQGTYSPDRTAFLWSGNFILNVKPMKEESNQLDNVSQRTTIQLEGPAPGIWPMKPKLRVGALVSSGRITNATGEVENPIWSGGVPVTIPLTKFNISKGLGVIWSVSTLHPRFSGQYSIPQFLPDGQTFKIKWTRGNFSFKLRPLWNTSLDVIDIGKEYATFIGSSMSKVIKSEDKEQLSSFQSLIMESADLAGSPLGKIGLKGLLTPDNLNFVWQGEAWFYPNKNTSGTNNNLKLQKVEDKPLYLSQFGGSVYDGSITSGSSNFFSFSHTIWSGNIPATIPFSSFWSGSFFSVTFTKGVSWTASTVRDSLISGTYSVPQISWDGTSTSVTWYKGDFQFYINPLWNATVTSLIEPGVQYYSTINFQGEKPVLAAASSVGVPLIPTTGVKAPIILQGNYSSDRSAFYWSGNFILNVKPT